MNIQKFVKVEQGYIILKKKNLVIKNINNQLFVLEKISILLYRMDDHENIAI